MNPSVVAVEQSMPDSPARFMSLADLSAMFRDQELYPHDGVAVEMPGSAITKAMTLNQLAEVEQYVNDLVIRVKGAESRKLRESVLQESIELATNSKDAFELHYLASMFIHHRDVMRVLARNPHLDERTQLLLATDVDLKRDRQVQLGLAHNPALSDTLMIKMLNGTEDLFVMKGIALNAVHKSQSTHYDSVYAGICRELCKSYDPVVRQTAISGVRDPAVLRLIAENNSVFLVPRELEAVASNKFTPDDVLESLSKQSFPAIQSMLSITVADRARSTLANKQYAAELSQTEISPV